MTPRNGTGSNRGETSLLIIFFFIKILLKKNYMAFRAPRGGSWIRTSEAFTILQNYKTVQRL